MKLTRSFLLRLGAAMCAVLVPVLVLAVGSDRPTQKKLPATPAPAVAYAPGPELEGSRLQYEQFWTTRLTYPTGRFDSRWVREAAKQDKLVERAFPAGWRASGRRSATGSSTALAVNAPPDPFESLGPQPQESTGCQAPCFTFGFVSGRVNAIAFDPVNTNVAYFASDGGGIWKTENCCTSATTWTVTTDQPSVSTTAVDDVTVDPNNANRVYAATGDISFGSFAFGSAGVLKSTDAGATWAVKGAADFAPPYLAAGAGTYPQYQAISKIKVDPNNSNKLIAGTKTGLYFSYDAAETWTGPCLTNNFTSQRQDVTDLIVRDDGTTTTVYAAIGARGFATTVQQNLGKNGANGIYRLGAIPASGCPAVGDWTPLTAGWPGGTAGGVACDPPIGSSDPCGMLRTVVPNPSFEADCAGVPCNWSLASGTSIERDTTQFHTGAASLKLTSATSPAQANADCVSSLPAGTYDASFWYRIVGASGANAAVTSVSLEAQFFSGASCTGPLGAPAVLTKTAPTKNGNWHQVKGTAPTWPVTTPAGTSSVQVRLRFDCAAPACGPAQVVNFDDVALDRANKLGRIEMAIAPSTLATPATTDDVLYAEVQAIDPQEFCGVLQVLGDTTARGCFLGLWRSGDGGNTWTQVADHSTLSFPEGTVTAGPCGEDTPQNWYNQGLAVDPMNPDALFMDAIDIWKSTDGGTTLTDISCGYYTGLNPIGAPVHVDNHALAYVPGNPTTLLAGNDGGIYVSNNAANIPVPTPTTIANPPTFTDINKTVSTIEFYSGDISANFQNAPNSFIVAGAQDNGSSYYQFTTAPPTCPPAGCQWSQRIGGDGMFARIEPKAGERVFMESQNGNLQRSTTGPAGPYTAIPRPWTGERLSFIFPYEIDKFACPTSTCDHMVAGSYRVWESIDGGSSWTPNSPDLTKGTLGDRSFINQLAYAYTTNGRAVVGTNDGNVQYGFGLGTGTANDADWVDLTDGNALLPNRPIMDVVFSPNNARVTYAAVGGFDQNTPATPGHVFRAQCANSICSSFTWTNKTGNLPNIPANAIVVNPNAPKQVFVGTDWGLYFTDDITQTTPVWKHVPPSSGDPNEVQGLPHTMIWDMTIDRGATTLAVFTRSRGAWAWPLPQKSPTEVSIFFDDFDTPPQPKPWTAVPDDDHPSCTWKHDTDPANAHSPVTSWTTTPYTDNCDTTLTSPAINVPAGSDTIRLTFWEKHETESDTNGGFGCPCDYGSVWLSVNGGAYQKISGNFEGVQLSYAPVSIPLPNSVAGTTIRVRFTFHSDGSVSAPPHQGWWIDDVGVSSEPPSGPTGVRVSSFAATPTRGAVTLRWRTAAEQRTIGFDVWRSSGTSTVKVNRTLVAARGTAAGSTYRLRDTKVRAGARYTYRLQLVDRSGKRTWGPRLTVRVPR